jgi:hypothetical protein
MGRNWCHRTNYFSLVELLVLRNRKVVPFLLRCHPDYRYGIDGFSRGHMDGWKTNGLNSGVILQFLDYHYFKTFDELGVKAQKFLNSYRLADVHRYCSYFDDGLIIHRSC